MFNNIFKLHKKQKRIINTGSNLPKPRMEDYFELRRNRDRLVIKPILKQSQTDGTILYGANALNLQLGKNYSRNSYDYDVYSKTPLKHAQQIEKSIDHGVNADLAYVEQTSYPYKDKEKTLFRVKLRNEIVEADYNFMPKNIKYEKIGGVRCESIGRASKKMNYIIRHPETGRGFKAIIDKSRINMFKWVKK